MPYQSLTHLVERCIAGDEAAWRVFVDQYSRLVYSIPRRNRFDDSACDDIFQEVFLAAYRHLDSLRDAQSVSKWLITTTTRACARYAKKNKQQITLGDIQKPSEPEIDRQEQLHALYLGLEQIGTRCRELLIRLHTQSTGSNYDLIAEEFDMPRGSIGPTRQRCLEKLARAIVEQEGLSGDS